MSATFGDDLVAFWRERHLCTVTTLRADGRPHVVPMGVVLDDEHALGWAITSRTSQKAVNLRRDPRIAVCQVDGRRWSTLEGLAEVLEEEATVHEAEQRYAARYRRPRENPSRVAIRFAVTGVLGNV